MVKISSSGDIVSDDNPRPDQGPRQRRENLGRVQHDDNPGAGQQAASVFDGLNQRLLGYGFPRFNLGSHTVEPIVSVGVILAALIFGLPGLVIAAILFFVVKMSTAGGGINSFFRGGGGARGGGGGGGQGGGHRLGNREQ